MVEHSDSIDFIQLSSVMTQAKRLAIEYRNLTGRPLGITGEVAEYEAARLLNLELAPVRQDGYDAIRADGTKLQIKARCLLEGAKKSQQVGGIKLKYEWDAVLLVILDGNLEPMFIYEADRPAVTEALERPGSKARNERGAMAVSKFKSIGRLIWSANG
jgi:hypothetical protein